MADIFITKTTDISQKTWESYLELLTDTDKNRAQFLSDINKRKAFILGRALIYSCLENKAPRENLKVLENGALYLDKENYLSLSHKDSYVLLASSDCPIGIDIEDLSKKRSFQDFQVGDNLDFSATDTVSFYQKFTQYEADYKLDCTSEKTLEKHHFFFQYEGFLICLSTQNQKETFRFSLVTPTETTRPLLPEEIVKVEPHIGE